MLRKFPCLFHVIQLKGIIHDKVPLIIGKSGFCKFQTVDDALRLLYRGKVAHHYHFFFIQVNLKIIKLRHTGISAAAHNNTTRTLPLVCQP